MTAGAPRWCVGPPRRDSVFRVRGTRSPAERGTETDGALPFALWPLSSSPVTVADRWAMDQAAGDVDPLTGEADEDYVGSFVGLRGGAPLSVAFDSGKERVVGTGGGNNRIKRASARFRAATAWVPRVSLRYRPRGCFSVSTVTRRCSTHMDGTERPAVSCVFPTLVDRSRATWWARSCWARDRVPRHSDPRMDA